MGIYTFYIGKGIVIPIIQFYEKYKGYFDEEVQKQYDDCREEVLEKLVTSLVGTGYDVYLLGHDAFKGREGRFDVGALENTNNMKTVKNIKKWYKESDNLKTEFMYIYKEDLMFIGKAYELDAGELSYAPPASELLYSLPAFLPQLVKYYAKLLPLEFEHLETKFKQKPTIWTFAIDCVNCCT